MDQPHRPRKHGAAALMAALTMMAICSGLTAILSPAFALYVAATQGVLIGVFGLSLLIGWLCLRRRSP